MGGIKNEKEDSDDYKYIKSPSDVLNDDRITRPLLKYQTNL
jgi:hypothetical protein